MEQNITIEVGHLLRKRSQQMSTPETTRSEYPPLTKAFIDTSVDIQTNGVRPIMHFLSKSLETVFTLQDIACELDKRD